MHVYRHTLAYWAWQFVKAVAVFTLFFALLMLMYYLSGSGEYGGRP